MYPYICCKSCGFSLGDKYAFYKEKMLQKHKKAIDSNETNKYKVHDAIAYGITAEDVLDSLFIEKECCRAAIMTQVLILDSYF